MRKFLLLAAALAPSGCGDPKPLPMAATAESSRAALVAGFDAWKQGKTPQDMQALSPPLTFADDDLAAGAKLLDYTIQGDGQPRGTGYSYTVLLKLQGKDGAKVRERKIAYRVVTDPKPFITREDRQ
jgi:hypothetical protein